MSAIRNVLFVMCDQMRWDRLSCAGHPFLQTPNIGALAQRGVRFPNASWIARTARWKYVHWTGGYRPQLFDLHDDPQEFRDLGADGTLAGVRDAMRHRLLTCFTRLKSRTTLAWAEAELRTDSFKQAGVFLGEW